MSTSIETVRAARTPLTDREKRRIVQLYTRKRDPLSIRLIAMEVGRAYGSVHRVLAETEGVVIRGQGGTRKKPTAKAAK